MQIKHCVSVTSTTRLLFHKVTIRNDMFSHLYTNAWILSSKNMASVVLWDPIRWHFLISQLFMEDIMNHQLWKIMFRSHTTEFLLSIIFESKLWHRQTLSTQDCRTFWSLLSMKSSMSSQDIISLSSKAIEGRTINLMLFSLRRAFMGTCIDGTRVSTTIRIIQESIKLVMKHIHNVFL